MNDKKPTTVAEPNSPFDISKMKPGEIRSMFMAVSARSLDNWLEYYQGREEYEVCMIIKEVRDIKKGLSGNGVPPDH